MSKWKNPILCNIVMGILGWVIYSCSITEGNKHWYYVEKPYDINELIESIDKVIEKKKK